MPGPCPWHDYGAWNGPNIPEEAHTASYSSPRAFALFGARTVARHVHRCAPDASLAFVKRSGHSGHLLGRMLSHQEAPTGLEFGPKKNRPKSSKSRVFRPFEGPRASVLGRRSRLLGQTGVLLIQFESYKPGVCLGKPPRGPTAQGHMWLLRANRGKDRILCYSCTVPRY